MTQKVLIDEVYTEGVRSGQTISGINALGRTYPVPAGQSVVRLQRWDTASRRWIDIGLGGNDHYGTSPFSVRGNAVLGQATYRVKVRERSGFGPGYSSPFVAAVYRRRTLLVPGWTQGASGASTATRWRQVDDARLIADVQPRTTRQVEAGTSSCRSIHIAASTRDLDSAPLVTVTSGGRQLYGGRFNHDSFGNWFINITIPISGARTRITFLNTTSGLASEFRTHLEGVCFT